MKKGRKRSIPSSKPYLRTVEDVLNRLPSEVERQRLKRQVEKRKKPRVPFKVRKMLRRAKKEHPSFEITPDRSIFLGTPHVYTDEEMTRHKPYFDKISSVLRQSPGEFEIFLEAHNPELLLDELGLPKDVGEEVVMKRLSKELNTPLKTFRSGGFSVEVLRKLENKRKASIAIAYRTRALIESLKGFAYTKQEAREMVLKGAQIKAGRLGIKPEYFKKILDDFSNRRIPLEEVAGAIAGIVAISNVFIERKIYEGLKESKASKFIFVLGDQHYTAAKRAHNRYLREKG